MSYTSDIYPLEFYIIYNRDGELEFNFHCPRCNDWNEIIFPLRNLDMDFSYEFDCISPRCTGKGERTGYMFEFSLRDGITSASLLGENDRPLHEYHELNLYNEEKHHFSKTVSP